LLGETLLERVLGQPEGQRLLDSLAAEVAARKKNPFAAVRELMTSGTDGKGPSR